MTIHSVGSAISTVHRILQTSTLPTYNDKADASLEKLVAAAGAQDTPARIQPPRRPGRPRGRLTAPKVCKAVGELMPDNAIVVDEAITSGLMLNAMTQGAPRHDLLTLTGGAIGQGLPSATGAASACPDRSEERRVG